MGDRASARLVAVAVLALLLFGWPFVAVVDVADRVLGIPVLWGWLMSAWAAVVVLVAASSRER
jgi:hypothetical protein